MNQEEEHLEQENIRKNVDCEFSLVIREEGLAKSEEDAESDEIKDESEQEEIEEESDSEKSKEES